MEWKGTLGLEQKKVPFTDGFSGQAGSLVGAQEKGMTRRNLGASSVSICEQGPGQGALNVFPHGILRVAGEGLLVSTVQMTRLKSS